MTRDGYHVALDVGVSARKEPAPTIDTSLAMFHTSRGWVQDRLGENERPSQIGVKSARAGRLKENKESADTRSKLGSTSNGVQTPKDAPNREGAESSAPPTANQRRILVGVLLAVAASLIIAFLMNRPSPPVSQTRGQETVSLPSGTATFRGQGPSGSTWSKLLELQNKVTNWLERQGGRDPASVSLRRLREDLGLSSEQLLDSWGAPIRYEPTGSGFRLRSSGPDRTGHTADDLVLGTAASPGRAP